MKLSKKQKKDVQIVYNNFWESYLSGAIESMGLLMSDDFSVIGSTAGEVFRNKEKVLRYYTDTADQIKNKLEFRNRNIELVNYDQVVLVNEYSDAYILIDNHWTFYSKVRLSSLLKGINNKWKFIQQHGSIPDSRAEDGEQIAFEKISKENIELRDAIKRRTIELENKSRELEIEAALERIRAISMSMKKAEGLLDVVEILFTELKTLGFTDIRNTIINIFDDAKEIFTNYDYSDYGVGGINEVDYNSHPSNIELVNKMREASKEFMITEFTSNELDEWKKWRIDQGQMPDTKLDQAESLYYYEFSIGVGSIGISTFSPINADQLKILNKVRNVFGLAYRRYADIVKADAHAREAKIEAGLERVRASAMAIHKSEQLSETAKVLFEEFAILGKIPDRMSIGIFNEDSKNVELWVTDQGGNDLNHKFFFSIEEPTSIAKIYTAWKDGKDSLLIDLTGKNLKDWLKFVKKEAKLPIDESKIKGRRVQQAAFFSHGFFLLTSHQPVADEIMILLVRFAKVFDQAYIRFLDLKKAEEQAREAQIEASLERVRARTMAMHQSSELKEVIQVVYDQFVQLNIHIEHAGFILDYKIRNDMHIWLADQHEVPSEVTIPYFDSPHWNSFIEAKEKGIDFFANHLSFDEKNKFYRDLFKFIPGVPEKTLEYYFSCPGLAISTVLLENVGLYIENFSGIPYSEEENDTLMRFGKVFQQTYTRFLDLIKAEAQAREAQIEAALERVRSRTMAMHKSEDLTSAVAAVFSELNELGFTTIRCGIGIFNDKSRKVNVWTASAGDSKDSAQLSGDEILEGHPLLEGIFNAWENQHDYSYVLEGEDLTNYYRNTSESNLPVTGPEKNDEKVTQYYYCVMFPAGGLFAFEENPFSDEAKLLMKRFADVFHLAFARHLDLKQAEVQAKEALIEAALERVRSKTMAMHNSQDVGATVVILFDEVLKLGLDKSIRCGIGILKKETDHMETWSATSDSKGEVDLKMGLLDMTIHPMLIGLKKAWQRGESGYSYDYIGDDVIKYYDALNKEPEYPFIRDLNKLPENEYHKSFFYPEGILFSFAPNPISDEAAKVLNRFASVFGQTYRRYLDLLKAEAQAREAQIEAALERVRARTMAMQKSNELAQTAAHLFSQLNELGIKPYRCNIAIIDTELNMCQLWSTTNHGNVIPTAASIPLDEYSVFKEMYDGWKSKKSGHVIKLNGEDRVNWTEYITKYVLFDAYKSKKIIKETLLRENTIFSNFYFKQGFFVIYTTEELSQANTKIIQRFAHIFEQTYTRFLDLHNAEIQNKIIQAENERKTQELEEARQLQLSMLPKELPKLPNLEIAVYMQTATEVGGDYYDFHVDEDGTLTAVIGDATGHGMKAGTIVTITKSLFNSLGSSKNILKTFSRISQVIKDMKFRQLSMCLSMLKINSNQLTLSSAAMPPALIYREKSRSVEEIEMKGMPLGAMKDFPYELHESQIENGDTILLLSDGLPELANSEQEMYGYDRIKNEFSIVGNKTPEEIISHFKSSASNWVNGNDPDDDVTFVIIKTNKK